MNATTKEILIVEDDPITQKLVGAIIKSDENDYTVHYASDTDECLRALKS